MSIEKKKVNRGAGRRRGSELSWAKLDESDILLIRELLKERDRLFAEAHMLTHAKIADKFSVSKRTIEKIAHGESWLHVRG